MAYISNTGGVEEWMERMTRYRKSVDANQAEIVAALRAAGWQVKDCHAFGGGLPDLAVWREGVRPMWLELKMPGEKMTEAEREFFSTWGPGPAYVVYSVEDALRLLESML